MSRYRGRKVEIRSIIAEPEVDDDPDNDWSVSPTEYGELADFAEELGLPQAASLLRGYPKK